MEYFWRFYQDTEDNFESGDYNRLAYYYMGWMAYIIRVLEANLWVQMEPDEQKEYQKILYKAPEGKHLANIQAKSQSLRKQNSVMVEEVSEDFYICLKRIVELRNIEFGHNYNINEKKNFCQEERKLFRELAAMVEEGRYGQWFFDKDVSVVRPFQRDSSGNRILQVFVVGSRGRALKRKLDDDGSMEVNRTYLVKMREENLYMPDVKYSPLKISPFADMDAPVEPGILHPEDYLRLLVNITDNYSGESWHNYVFLPETETVSNFEHWDELKNIVLEGEKFKRQYSRKRGEKSAWCNEFEENYHAWNFIQTRQNQDYIQVVRDYCLNKNPENSILVLMGSGGRGKTSIVQYAVLSERERHSVMEYASFLIFLTAKTEYVNVLRYGQIKDTITNEYFASYEDMKKQLNQILFEKVQDADCERGGDIFVKGNEKPRILILDDFESLPKEERIKILNYLRKIWVPKGNRAIITSRPSLSAFCVEAKEVEVKAMDEWTAAEFVVEALRMWRVERERLNTVRRAFLDSEESKANRERLLDMTQGLPTYCLIFARYYINYNNGSENVFEGMDDFDKVHELGYDFLYGKVLEYYQQAHEQIILAMLGSLFKHEEVGEGIYESKLRVACHMLCDFIESIERIEDDEIKKLLQDLEMNHIIYKEHERYNVLYPSMRDTLKNYTVDIRGLSNLAITQWADEIAESLSCTNSAEFHKSVIEYMSKHPDMTIIRRKQRYSQLIREIPKAYPSKKVYKAIFEVLNDFYFKWCGWNADNISPQKFEDFLDDEKIDCFMESDENNLDSRVAMLKIALLRMDCRIQVLNEVIKGGKQVPDREDKYFNKCKEIYEKLSRVEGEETEPLKQQYKEKMVELFYFAFDRYAGKYLQAVRGEGKASELLALLRSCAPKLINELKEGAVMEEILKDFCTEDTQTIMIYNELQEKMRIVWEECKDILVPRIKYQDRLSSEHTKLARALGRNLDMLLEKSEKDEDDEDDF